MESRNKLLVILLSTAIALLGYLAYEVIKPFIIPILWAVVLAIAFQPLHRFIYTRIRKNSLASLITLIVILLIILGPVAYLSYKFVSEILGLASSMANRIRSSGDLQSYASNLAGTYLSKLGFSQSEVLPRVEAFVTDMAKQTISALQEKAAQAFRIGFDFIVMAIALFFVLRDGPSVLRRLTFQFPLSRERKERIQSLVRDVVSSSFYGTGVSMGIHGALGFLLFLIFGVPIPVLLAALVAILSIVPVIGSLFIWVGVILYLFLQHRIAAAVSIAVIALVGTQLIDHWLRPLLVGSRGRLSFFAVFFGILGGLEFFGLIGFVLGPLILILFQSLISLSLEVWNEAGG